jgi:hypothetical protein
MIIGSQWAIVSMQSEQFVSYVMWRTRFILMRFKQKSHFIKAAYTFEQNSQIQWLEQRHETRYSNFSKSLVSWLVKGWHLWVVVCSCQNCEETITGLSICLYKNYQCFLNLLLFFWNKEWHLWVVVCSCQNYFDKFT